MHYILLGDCSVVPGQYPEPGRIQNYKGHKFLVQMEDYSY